MPNALAYLALILWPVAAVALYRRMPLERAVIWSILGPYLFLPPVVAIDFPLIPQLDKVSIPNASAFLILTLMLGHRIPLLPRSGLAKVLVVLFLATPVASVLTNGDAIYFVSTFLPGLRTHDTIATIISQLITLTPFLLGRRFLASETAPRELLVALVAAGLLYSIPMLIEIRLSPQLNTWIYGFFQHDFSQMMRGGGFRPIVFLYHGLWVAFLTFMTAVAAAALWRWPPRPGEGARYFLATGWLALLLLLCKSAAALLYGLAAIPMARFMGIRGQIRVAALLGLVAISYPLLRGAGLVPVEGIVAQASAVSPERGRSVAFRFQNEEALLDHAAQRPFFGWGPWGRNQLYDAFGKMISVTDGRWIIVIGMFGWSGYLAEFGLLALPLFLLARRSLGAGAETIPPHAAPLALILGFNLLDMLPNATLIPFTWLIAGALLGLCEERVAARAPLAPEEAPAPARPRTVL